jgi:hypothetical protein
MCIFSQPVEHVSKTNIFARRVTHNRQLLVYSMSYSTTHAVAMILPIPVARPCAEDAVEFINLEDCKSFFSEMHNAFTPPSLQLKRFGRSRGTSTLEVHDVGAFSASFIPRADDFSRLDPLFRLPDDVLTSIPQYEDFGFVAFQLKPCRLSESELKQLEQLRIQGHDTLNEAEAAVNARQKELNHVIEQLVSICGSEPRLWSDDFPLSHTIGHFKRSFDDWLDAQSVAQLHKAHPMAFSFPTRLTDELFFPTVHVHDGGLPHKAKFDHWLFCQTPEYSGPLTEWSRSNVPAGDVMSAKALCVVDKEQHIMRRKLVGTLPNVDTILATA